MKRKSTVFLLVMILLMTFTIQSRAFSEETISPNIEVPDSMWVTREVIYLNGEEVSQSIYATDGYWGVTYSGYIPLRSVSTVNAGGKRRAVYAGYIYPNH